MRPLLESGHLSGAHAEDSSCYEVRLLATAKALATSAAMLASKHTLIFRTDPPKSDLLEREV